MDRESRLTSRLARMQDSRSRVSESKSDSGSDGEPTDEVSQSAVVVCSPFFMRYFQAHLILIFTFEWAHQCVAWLD